MREGRACHGRGGGRPRTSAPTTPSRLLAGSRPCTLAKTDCGVARFSGRRSHIGLCQNCVREASAFQRRTPTRRPRQARPSRVAHGRARRPRRAVYAKAPAGTPRTRGRPRTSAPTTLSRLLAGSRPCTLAKTDCGVARYSGRRSNIGLCPNCVCEASAFQRRTPTRRPRQARPSRSHPGGRDKRGPPVSHR